MLNIMVTCAFGLEGLVAKELRRLGYEDLNVNNGHIEFESDERAVVSLNLWLRCADRVYIKISQFKALDFGQLFDEVRALNWSDFLVYDARFPIRTIAIKESQLHSKSACQSLIKKAIVESLREGYSVKDIPETGALYSVRVHNFHDEVSLYLDTTGESLHKRGYRLEQGEAPIKETLAAALLMCARWPRFESQLWDPCCGTGTLLIEATLLALNRAPGLMRSFVAEQWPLISPELWEECRQKAKEKERGIGSFRIQGSDIDQGILECAQVNIQKAGLEDMIQLKQCAIKDLSRQESSGIIVSNPPYGERLLEQKKISLLYREMGEVFRNQFPRSSYFIITPDERFENLFGQKAKKNRKLYNGALKCYLYQYF